MDFRNGHGLRTHRFRQLGRRHRMDRATRLRRLAGLNDGQVPPCVETPHRRLRQARNHRRLALPQNLFHQFRQRTDFSRTHRSHESGQRLRQPGPVTQRQSVLRSHRAHQASVRPDGVQSLLARTNVLRGFRPQGRHELERQRLLTDLCGRIPVLPQRERVDLQIQNHGKRYQTAQCAPLQRRERRGRHGKLAGRLSQLRLFRQQLR